MEQEQKKLDEVRFELPFHDKIYGVMINNKGLHVDNVGTYNLSSTFSVEDSQFDHVCGMQGFGQGIDDYCPRCRDQQEKSIILEDVAIALRLYNN